MLMAFVINSLTSCKVLVRLEPEYDYEYPISSRQGSYKINPDTILESLSQGEKDVFTQQIGTPEASNITTAKLVQWTQADYFMIAQTLHKFVWGENWQDWKVTELFFRMDCQQAGKGPQIFYIKLYKIAYLRDKDLRLIHDIGIRPLENSVEWYEKKMHPIREVWKSIDISQINVPVETALQIAEEKGGYNARSKIENQCVIYIQMFANAMDEGWKISYSADDKSNDFDVFVDPVTGKFSR
jgi:hypothetical protein